jgi:hypothetical protein
MRKRSEPQRIRFYGEFSAIVIFGFLLIGCETLSSGSGKSAKIEDTGFFARYDDLKAESDPAFVGLPALYAIRPGVNWAAYKKIIIPDFTSLKTNVKDLSGMQLAEYKTIKKDLADHLAQAYDGSVFLQCVRTSERIDPKDIEAIKKLPADAILMGNIKELHSAKDLTVTQVEIKIVETKNGMEILKAINRNSTDHDKVAMPIVSNLSVLINKAKSAKVAEPEKGAAKSSPLKEEIPASPPTPAPKSPAMEAQAAAVPPSVGSAEANAESKPAVAEKPAASFLILTKAANIRSEPNIKSKVITILKKGSKVEKLDKSGSWFKIKLPSGITGWVFQDLVKEAQ